ncbi:MAG: hypothetical protein FJW96_04095, partial [Actinobacteria bacterium]|nr:hypothetical protein [Actinomycetota bacterium]
MRASGIEWRALVLSLCAASLLGWGVFSGATPGMAEVFLVGAAAAVAACVAAVLVGAPRLGRAGLAVVAAVVCLVALAALSLTWSIAPDRSWDAVNLGLASLAFLVLGALVSAAGGRWGARVTLVAISAVVVAALVWALAGVVVPALFPEGDRIARLREPLGHAPALSLLAGALLPVAGSLLTQRPVARSLGTLLAYGAVVTVMLTQSRAGVIASVVVVALWAALAGEPILRIARLLPAVVPAVVVGALAFTQSALVEDGSARADREDAGVLFAIVALVGAAIAVGLELRLPVERI